MLSVHNYVVSAIDGGLVTGLVMLDRSSAFDTVDHSTLSSVLTQRFCISGSAISGIDSYLSTSIMSFKLCSWQTEPFTVDCGVSQGSVLGPLQFICYTENVQHVFQQHKIGHHIFADDKQMYTSGGIGQLPDIRQQMSDCANSVDRWCDS